MGSAPAMAVFNNKLYVAHLANHGTQEPYVTSSPHGVNFAPPTRYTNLLMGRPPAPAVYIGRADV